MVSINFEFTIEVEISTAYEVEVEVEYDEEYGVVEYEVEVEVEIEEPEAVEYEFDTGDYENWGNECVCPATGWYAQFGQKQGVEFYNFQVDVDGWVRGAGQDPNGEFDIGGQLEGKFFVFNKTYRGAHNVVYRGKVKKGVWSGTWEIPGNCDGVFNLVPTFQKWKGGFWQFGNKTDMYFQRMYLGESGVFGNGADDVGQFNIRGWKNDDIVCFAKTYVGAHTVFYQGQIDGKHLRGQWTIPGNCDGVFAMKTKRAIY
jgi:hypothetical protein